MSPPPDPDRIARAMVGPLWSALVRTDSNLKTIGTWDTTLIRHPRLLVPIDVQALYVAPGSAERFVRLPFALLASSAAVSAFTLSSAALNSGWSIETLASGVEAM